jgi:hypothetical protein
MFLISELRLFSFVFARFFSELFSLKLEMSIITVESLECQFLVPCFLSCQSGHIPAIVTVWYFLSFLVKMALYLVALAKCSVRIIHRFWKLKLTHLTIFILVLFVELFLKCSVMKRLISPSKIKYNDVAGQYNSRTRHYMKWKCCCLLGGYVLSRLLEQL